MRLLSLEIGKKLRPSRSLNSRGSYFARALDENRRSSCEQTNRLVENIF